MTPEQAAKEVEKIIEEKNLLENKLCETQCELEKAREAMETMRQEGSTIMDGMAEQYNQLRAVADDFSRYMCHKATCPWPINQCNCGLKAALARYESLVEGRKA